MSRLILVGISILFISINSMAVSPKKVHISNNDFIIDGDSVKPKDKPWNWNANLIGEQIFTSQNYGQIKIHGQISVKYNDALEEFEPALPFTVNLPGGVIQIEGPTKIGWHSEIITESRLASDTSYSINCVTKQTVTLAKGPIYFQKYYRLLSKATLKQDISYSISSVSGTQGDHVIKIKAGEIKFEHKDIFDPTTECITNFQLASDAQLVTGQLLPNPYTKEIGFKTLRQWNAGDKLTISYQGSNSYGGVAKAEFPSPRELSFLGGKFKFDKVVYDSADRLVFGELSMPQYVKVYSPNSPHETLLELNKFIYAPYKNPPSLPGRYDYYDKIVLIVRYNPEAAWDGIAQPLAWKNSKGAKSAANAGYCRVNMNPWSEKGTHLTSYDDPNCEDGEQCAKLYCNKDTEKLIPDGLK
jgi:hypothetical protein